MAERQTLKDLSRRIDAISQSITGERGPIPEAASMCCLSLVCHVKDAQGAITLL